MTELDGLRVALLDARNCAARLLAHIDRWIENDDEASIADCELIDAAEIERHVLASIPTPKKEPS